MTITTPITREVIQQLRVGDKITICGPIYTGRDAVLPKLVALKESGGGEDIPLEGSVVFHTAVSPAGVGPTSSNKLEIESSIGPLSKLGVRIHLGKGKLSEETVRLLDQNDSIYAVIPPVTALLESQIRSRRVVAYPEEGMEALHELQVEGFTAIVAAAHGESIYK
ncbi:MAG: fumarate hydratase C-terminal domain-containing protein [Oscillospiraceae bacterium]|nr:fumarate hydratase C-terminal domain-containing protein [Oscillospiraceae bacterium]